MDPLYAYARSLLAIEQGYTEEFYGCETPKDCETCPAAEACDFIAGLSDNFNWDNDARNFLADVDTSLTISDLRKSNPEFFI